MHLEINLKIEGSTVTNSQVNVAAGGSSIAANQTICDSQELKRLIDKLLNASKTLNEDDIQVVNECIETIATIKDEKPKKSIIKMAISTLKELTGPIEFVAAASAIAQFVMEHL